MINQSVSKELSNLKGTDYLSSSDFNSSQLKALLQLSLELKKEERRIDLGNRVLGLIFNKPSTRTRVSFQVAMARLGGQTINLDIDSSQLGRGEPMKDTARVLSRYCDALAIRTFSHSEIIDYAHWASIPVINALTDLEHPCQSLADFLTMQEVFGDLNGLKLSYVGDGNNVLHSLMLCGALFGVNVSAACPKGFEPEVSIQEKARSMALQGTSIEVFNDPFEAVDKANVIYTDVWASMGQEEEKDHRKIVFKDFVVDDRLLNHLDKEAIILHCLPAHRGEEITEKVLEGKSSRVFDQAENRLHVQQALLATLLGGL